MAGHMVLPKGCADIHMDRTDLNFKLSRVGITGVRKPVNIRRDERVVTLSPRIDVFVDLPSDMRGSHMSRNAEAIAELVDRSVREPFNSLEDLCLSIVDELLERHDYANRAEVNMESDYFREQKTPNGTGTIEHYSLMARAVHNRGGTRKKLVGVTVVGMTACPCAMQTVQEIVGSEGSDSGSFGVSHNQRNLTTLMLEVPDTADVEADDLIDIVERSLSAPTREILKREDEAKTVIQAHQNPRFVEDVARNALARVVDRYRDLSDDVDIMVRSVAEESIHKHNAVAERSTTMGELRS